MLDEWKTEEGIKVIDGWSFQVSCFAYVIALILNAFDI